VNTAVNDYSYCIRITGHSTLTICNFRSFYSSLLIF